MSASAKRKFTRSVKRDTLTGGDGEGLRRRRTRSDNVAALLGRLRRLELLVCALSGEANNLDFDVEAVVKQILSREKDLGDKS